MHGPPVASGGVLLHPSRPRTASLVVAVAVAVALSGCDLPTSDGGEVVIATDDRVEEVRAAREVLAEPVPAVVGEAERLVAALRRVWTEEASVEARAALAEALRPAPFEEALAELAAVDLDGDGPDVVAASALLDDLVRDGRALLAVTDEELASVTALPPFDRELEDLLSGWDARGSYSQQLTAFEELAAEAEALAAVAAERTATPACVELWPRRSGAAATVAERTRELRGLIRDRRGQEFDELRDEYRQDPYGTGGLLGVLDAQAASACWADGSEAPGLVVALQEHVGELGDVLDPPDLQG